MAASKERKAKERALKRAQGLVRYEIWINDDYLGINGMFDSNEFLPAGEFEKLFPILG